jgi:cyclopropane fatty-acyl-phospholipid synthase-like methyltransferase
MSWEKAWREGRTGWDAGASPPVLEELVSTGQLPAGRALVPGCGAGYDVLTLATEERSAVGLDLAPTAAARFESLRAERGVPRSRARVVTEDFFAFEPDAPFDLVWDYTFLCALDPSVRATWAKKVERLLADDGELVTLIFPAVDEPPLGQGPPHPLKPEHVRELLEPRFAAVELRPVARTHPGREGKEWLGRWRRR